MDEPVERFQMDRMTNSLCQLICLKSDYRWSYLDGQQIYDYVVFLSHPSEARKYKEIDFEGNFISQPGENDVVFY